MSSDTDRGRGVLTPADREYLLGEREMGHEQSARNAEARIRRRITDAILDFGLLVHTLDRRNRRQVFERASSDEEFLDAITAMLSFAYIGLKEEGIDFERSLVPAIKRAEEVYAADQLSANVSVDVTFDVETTVESTLSGIESRLAAGEPVTPRELFSLVVEGGHDVSAHDRITLRLEDETDPEHVDRLASYLEASVRRPTTSVAVLHWDDEG